MKITVEVHSHGQARLIENMAAKLREGSTKPRKWPKFTTSELLKRVKEESTEMAMAVGGNDVWEEAADVANFAAMYADVKTRGPNTSLPDSQKGESHE